MEISSPGRRPRASVRAYAGICGLLAILFLFYVVPILTVVIGAFRSAPPGSPGTWTLSGIVGAYADPVTYKYLGNSLVLAALVCVFATLISVVLAWIVTRTTSALARLVTPMMVLVMATPPLFFALSWELLGTPRLGLVNKAMAVVGFSDTAFGIGGLWGSVFVLSLKVSAISYFMVIGPFAAMDRRLEEASLISGAGRLATLVQVNVPVMAPAVAGAMIISFVIGLVSFDVPLIISLPSGFRVFSTQIYAFINDDTPPNYAGASALAILLIIAVLVLVLVKWRLLDRRQFATLTGKGSKADPWDLGAWSWLCNGVVVVFGLLALVLPTLQLVLGSLQPAFGIGNVYSLENYVGLLDDPFTGPALTNTFVVSIVGGVIAVALAFTVGVVGRSAGRVLRRTLELSTWLPWAAHGIVLGLGLVWAFLAVPFLTPLFGTVWIVLIGLVVAATPLVSRTIDGAMSGVATELEEAARAAGASASRTSVGVVGRLVLPSLVAAWLIAFVNIAGNLDVPILLSSPTNRTVAVTVYNLYTTGETSQAAALFCVVLATTVVFGGVGFLVVRISARMLRVRRQRVGFGFVQAEEDRAQRHPELVSTARQETRQGAE